MAFGAAASEIISYNHRAPGAVVTISRPGRLASNAGLGSVIEKVVGRLDDQFW
jgi:hypothetical protein